MKKFFSFTFSFLLMISMISLVGCNGLWDFDDDDDITVSTISFKIPSKVALGSVETDLLAKIATQTADIDYSKLTATVKKTLDDSIVTQGIGLNEDGSFEAKFNGFAGAYYFEISNSSGTLKLYLFFDQLDRNNSQPQNPVTVDEETTAVGLSILAAKKNDPSVILKVENFDANTIASLTAIVEDGVKSATGTEDLVNSDDFVYAVAKRVEGVSLNKNVLNLAKGGAETLKASISPEDATFKGVSWSSDDSTVATVDENGLVKALKVGTANISVTTKDGSKKATCKLTVTAAEGDVIGVSLNKNSTSIDIGQTETLEATVEPSDANDPSVTWESDKDAVATVDSSGKITGVAIGTATISVKTNDGGYEDSCVVSVSAIEVTGVALNKNSTSIDIGQTETLTATVSPADATDKSLEWSSDNDSVATVDSSGVVTAVGAGSANIVVATVDGNFTATCVVTVQISVTNVSLNKSTTLIQKGSTETLTATVSPANATDKSLAWSSDNEFVATVDSNGTVTAVGDGSANITVTTTDGGFTATCEVLTEVATVNFDNEVADLSVADLQIHISGVPSSFTTQTTVAKKGDSSTTATIEKSTLSTSNSNLTLKNADFDLWITESFQSLTFNPAIPVGATVEIKKPDGTLLATGNNL